MPAMIRACAAAVAALPLEIERGNVAQANQEPGSEMSHAGAWSIWRKKAQKTQAVVLGGSDMKLIFGIEFWNSRCAWLSGDAPARTA